MGKKSRMKKLRKVLRPQPPRAAQRTNSKRNKVMGLLEELVDTAREDLRSGAEKPRVSYAQAMKAAQLMMDYDEGDETTEVELEPSVETVPLPEDYTHKLTRALEQEARSNPTNTE